MARNARHRKANIFVARIIPLILIGIIGYASWVVTRRVCLDYLLSPPEFSDAPRRPGAAIAILVTYYFLLLPVLASYTRLIHTIVTNPGYIPRGGQWEAQAPQEKQRAPATEPGSDYSPRSSDQDGAAFKHDFQPRVQDFWLKDVFICNYDGRPPFCSTCLNFKPDRTHHCSEVDRCVRKMDHFCPWVGGIVSETSVKFFIQFCFYAALFCANTLVFMAYFFAERHRQTGFLDVHWILTLAFAAMFLLFSIGMFGSTFQLTAINSTTVENLSRKTKVWYLAVYMPRPEEVVRRVESRGMTALRTIAYPRPAEEQQTLLKQSGTIPAQASTTATHSQASVPVRTFAILETPAGFNPWDCGTLQNIKEVMGNNLLDWFLPVRYSPCANHSSNESMFRLGPQVERLKEESGLVPSKHEIRGNRPAHRKKRRRKGRVLPEEQQTTDRGHTSEGRPLPSEDE